MGEACIGSPKLTVFVTAEGASVELTPILSQRAGFYQKSRYGQISRRLAARQKQDSGSFESEQAPGI
jgi:hypothetical protein